MGRCPSVPSDSFQLAPQQVSRVDNGFDLSITSSPLMCLSPDGSRLCPSFAESTPSVPLFSLAISLSRTVQTSSGARERSNTAFLVQETLSSQLDIRSLFLLDQSLLTVPVFERMIQVANTLSCLHMLKQTLQLCYAACSSAYEFNNYSPSVRTFSLIFLEQISHVASTTMRAR
jgi:hypothetical protein